MADTDNLIVALDVGTSKVIALIAQVTAKIVSWMSLAWVKARVQV
jgi:cell division ATPase FtsA